jgi:hypothetical protein
MYCKGCREKSDGHCIGDPKVCRLDVCDDETKELKVSIESCLCVFEWLEAWEGFAIHSQSFPA